MVFRSSLSVEDWQHLNRLLEQALEVDPAARAAWIDALPPGATHLRSLLIELLAQSEGAGFATGINPHTTVARLASEALAAMRHEQTGDRIGPWRLERLLAEGGMGTVWVAERADGVMQRTAALKLPRADWVDHGLTERIARERSILALLQHPHIALLYDAGVTERGRPYLALEYVVGVPINDYCRSGSLGLSDVLRLFVQVARAVAYAHSRLVIHRDLKPGNVLVTADGMPKLLDFGISKLLEGDALTGDASALTRMGGRALTPAYAAPEQILGLPISVAADVYALGVMLFELTTGTRLYSAGTPRVLEEEILRGELRRPSDAAPDKMRARALRGDLDAIICIALKRQPDQRYQSAATLADDLERYLAGQPVRAQPDRRSYRLRKFIVRNKLPVAAGSAIALALGVGLGVALWQADAARAQAAVAREQAARATALNTFVLSLIRQTNPRATQASRNADLALLASVEQRIDTEFKGSPDQLLQLRLTVGDAYRERGQHAAAGRVYRRASNEAQTALPANHLGLLKARVAGAFYMLADDESVRYIDPTIDSLRNAGPEAIEPLVDALLARVQTARHIGHRPGMTWDSLYADSREAYDLATRYLGAGSARQLHAVQSLASNLISDPGSSRPAEDRRREAFEVMESALGSAAANPATEEGNFDVLLTEALYGFFQCRFRNFEEGLRRLWDTVAMAQKHHSDDSFALELAFTRLGSCLASRSDPEAVWMTLQAYEIVTKRAEPSPFILARLATTVAALQCDARRTSECIEFTEKALAHAGVMPAGEIRSRIISRMRPLQVRGLILQGQTEQAETMATEFLVEPYCREAALHLLRGAAMRLNGRFEQAVRSANAAISIARSNSEDSLVVRILVERALAELELQNPATALASIEEAMPKLKRDPGQDVDWGTAHLAHGKALLANGRAADALEPLRKSYGFWLGQDPKSVWAAEAEYWFGQAYIATGDAKRGRWMMAEAKRALAASAFHLHRALASDSNAR